MRCHAFVSGIGVSLLNFRRSSHTLGTPTMSDKNGRFIDQ
jgi:hypothetical protein